MTTLKGVLLHGKAVDIRIDGGLIVEIADDLGLGDERYRGLEVYAGLIDIHTHGCMGYDTMDCELQVMAEYYLKNGITTFYPTTMTMSRERIIAATKQRTDFPRGANVPGFHMEGPFINENLKGAQAAEHIIPPSAELVSACERVKRITLAPEIEGSLEFIKNCSAQCSIGHTECDYDTAKRAIECGATSLTHTYNCMPGMHHRRPGPIPAGAESGIYAELICDGVHIHPAMVRTLVALYGTDRVILISDSMRATGLEDGKYDLGGQTVTVSGGVAYTDGGNLAGSTTNLFECVRRAISFGISKEDAFKMASANPARLMGLNKGEVKVGLDADLIFVDGECRLVGVMKGGEII
jgi:N-acetylglucosamine-6-phosphate deacetylase